MTAWPALRSSTPQVAKRRELGASLSKVMTGTPCATASSIAGVIVLTSEQESSTAPTFSATACWMRCTCSAASSRGGVSHSISIGRPSSALSARARFSAPRREARNDGLLALLAIIAIRNGATGGGGSPTAASGRERQAVASVAMISAATMRTARAGRRGSTTTAFGLTEGELTHPGGWLTRRLIGGMAQTSSLWRTRNSSCHRGDRDPCRHRALGAGRARADRLRSLGARSRRVRRADWLFGRRGVLCGRALSDAPRPSRAPRRDGRAPHGSRDPRRRQGSRRAAGQRGGR